MLDIILSAIFFMLLVVLGTIRNERWRKRQNLPPGPYDLPILGGAIQSLLTVGFKGKHCDKVHRFSQRYGKIGFCRCIAQQAVVIEDYNLIKEVLNSPDWSSRFPSHPRFHEHTLYQNIGLMWSDGDAHKEMRKFTTKTLKTFGFGELKSAEIFLQEELSEFTKLIDETRELNNDEIAMQHFFKVPSFNVLWRVMAGYRFMHNDAKIKELIHAVEDVGSIEIGLDLEWAFPILRHVPYLSPSRAKTPAFETCHNFFKDILAERRRAGTYKEIQADFIDLFIKQIDDERDNPKSYYTDDQFVITCVDLLFGGIDTTANSLEFGILYLTKNQEAQRRAQDEIDFIVGKDREPSISDRSMLKYCEAVMWETLRMANIVPINGRTAVVDTKIGQYNIPRDVMCGLNTTYVHLSEEIWGADASEFNPSRFLDPNNNLINTEKIFAFGGGKRLCLGSTMAKVIWIAFIATLLQKYNFKPSTAHPQLDTEPIPGVANTPKPFYCIVTPRKIN